MSDSSWTGLRERLLDRYDDFVRKLTRRLGSADLAREAVHETFLRLQRTDPSEPVRNLDAYLFRTAINIAKNKRKVESRYLTFSETEALVGIPDDTPDPARVAESRSEVALLVRALAELPPRRRAIFEASWAGGVPHATLAATHNVHLRTIQRELELAAEHVRRFCKEKDRASRRNSHR
ncbi:RNA polymerase sigma factor [Caulobacter endophyticus]|uniref:RNA polymerase sigma factor n=1 Tax=Caulobacter endophyticus TaxID=2172652 RepID=UPI00240F4D82|nr:RNA polymerase sigma factor [Caulobacter endophyticus]MDG2527264.1 RNA polymerase sigma factor [Caulobacter endophyticus]